MQRRSSTIKAVWSPTHDIRSLAYLSLFNNISLFFTCRIPYNFSFRIVLVRWCLVKVYIRKKRAIILIHSSSCQLPKKKLAYKTQTNELFTVRNWIYALKIIYRMYLLKRTKKVFDETKITNEKSEIQLKREKKKKLH